MALSDVVDLTITLNSQTPSRAGFGRALLVGYHTKFATLTKLYTQPDELLTDGFTVNDKLYKDAVALKSENPAPKDFKVGRLATAHTQIIRLIPTIVFVSATNTYSGTIGGLAWTFTSDATPTLAEVCTGIAAAITALAGVTASGVSGTHVDVTTDTAGAVLQYTGHTTNLAFNDVSVDSSIATDLAAIYAYDADWYAITLATPQSQALFEAAAAWVETKRRLLSVLSSDTETLTGSSDVFTSLDGLNYFRTFPVYHPEVGNTLNVKQLVPLLVNPPGSTTVAHKTFRGVTGYTLSAAQEAQLKAKHANTYTQIAGNYVLLWGTVAGGDYADIVIGIDWLYARIQEDVAGLFQSRPKVPFTNPGAAAVQGTIQARLDNATQDPINFLHPGDGASIDPPFCTVPDVADVDSSDKADRVLPDVRFAATLQGAIHAVRIAGVVQV